MFNEGTMAACKGAFVAFALLFFWGIFNGASVLGACYRGSLAALAVFLFIKVAYHLFFSALMDQLSDFVKEKKQR